MELPDAIKLIKHKNILNPSKTTWADLGCGSGLFTVAISNLLAPGSKIYAVDTNIKLFKSPVKPHVVVEKIKADFVADPLAFKNLDGILMANSLHFVQNKDAFIRKIKNHLNPNGCYLIVEYDMDTSNPWVPFPISYNTLRKMFEGLGYTLIEKIYELPSRYNRANIYSVLVKG